MLEVITILCVLLCGFYLIPARHNQGRRGMLTLAPAMAASAWLITLETLITLYPSLQEGRLRLLLFSQYLLCPTWLLFSLAYGRKLEWGLLDNLNKLLAALSLLPLLFILPLPPTVFFFVTDFSFARIIFLEPPAFFFYLHLVLVLLLSVGNLESTLRTSRHSERWRIKFAVLGAGTITAAFALFYSQALLSKTINMSYLPLRDFGILMGLGLLYMAEWRRQGGKVIIPRRVAFRSLATVIAGLYLLGLGLAREGARIFGIGFGQHLVLGLLFLAGLCGLILLLSQSLRRRADIWLQRTFYNEKYDYRGQWMRFSELLSKAESKESLIRAVLLDFCETFGFSGAMFLPVENADSNRLGLPIRCEMDKNSESNDEAMAEACAFLLNYPGAPTRVDSVLLEHLPAETARHLLAVQASLFFTVSTAGKAEGILILGRAIDGKEEYDQEDFELMDAMGRQVGLCLHGFRLGDELSVAREMEALGRLGAFVMHDLKNQVYTLSLLSENARSFIANPDFQRDMLESLGSTVANMKILISQLTGLPRTSSLHLEPVNLLDAARRAAAMVPGADVRISGMPLMVEADAEQLCKVLANLCLNAVEAGGDKPIHIETEVGDVPMLHVRDSAGGIAEEVLKRGLFKPFNTGKQRGMGIGLYHSRKIMEAHGGSIFVDNHPGEGSTFTVCFNSSGVEGRHGTTASDH